MDEEDEDCWNAFGSSSDEDEDDDDDDEDDVDVNEFLQNEEEKNELLYDRPHKGSKKSSGIISVKEKNKIASAIAMHLSQTFVKHNPQIRLSDRSGMVLEKGRELSDDNNDNDDDDDDYCIISKCLKQREIQVIRQKISTTSTNITMVDAMIILDFDNVDNHDHILSEGESLIESVLCPGGVLIFPVTVLEDDNNKSHINNFTTSSNKVIEELLENDNGAASVLCTVNVVVDDDIDIKTKKTIRWIARRKKSIRVHSSTCPWLSSSHSVPDEEERLKLATVTLSSHEINSLSSSSTVTVTATATATKDDGDDRLQLLTDHSIQKAAQNMNNYGYCILPRVLNTDKCKNWGQAVIECVHSASKILLDRDNVDIYDPHSSQFEPQSYQELSMREDLRLDLRKGPALDRMRSSSTGDDVEFLRDNSSLLEIIRRTMNPRDESGKKLWLGNIGRFNFGGSGNDGSYQNLRISDVGGIVSLPGAADQALHADTPHLFEHNTGNLPAHYINMFAPCTNFNEEVGGTAFIHGSHSLEFTAKHYGQDSNNSIFYPYLVRPRLEIGDVILFDCRILHFGLANTSRTIERCICYSNTWMDWFHDKKNWDKNRAIFNNDEDNNNNDDEKSQEQK
jgi:hypothetical protein